MDLGFAESMRIIICIPTFIIYVVLHTVLGRE